MWSRRAGEREHRALVAEAHFAEARLAALPMQINPHFLFNALNGLSTLIHTDARAADTMLGELADDEPLARRGLRLLARDQPDLEIIGECESGPDALVAIESDPPALIFLDVQMPEMDGFELLAKLPRDRLPLVIFTTAYNQHAVRASRRTPSITSSNPSDPLDSKSPSPAPERTREIRRRALPRAGCSTCSRRSKVRGPPPRPSLFSRASQSKPMTRSWW